MYIYVYIYLNLYIYIYISLSLRDGLLVQDMKSVSRWIRVHFP